MSDCSNDSNSKSVLSALKELGQNAKDFYLPGVVPELHEIPSELQFLRDYVTPNLPVVIRGGVKEWPALQKWTNEYLCEKLGEKKITVAMTPDGMADAAVGSRFIQPHEELMTFRDFIGILCNQDNDSDHVVYVQKQNSSFTEEFSELLPDTATEIGWASRAFGCSPDAVNFWMGDAKSITSMHKDPYENMYAVIRGAKTFILHPPTDLYCIPYNLYTAARYKRVGNGYMIVDERNHKCCKECRESQENCRKNLDSFHSPIKNKSKESGIETDDQSDNGNINSVVETEQKRRDYSQMSTNKKHNPEYQGTPITRKDLRSDHIENESEKNLCSCHDTTKVPWISIDPLNPDLEKYPSYKYSHSLTVTVNPGDLLYLPSLWFHHVKQQDGTVAVNFWYDMQYDIKYVYYKLVEKITQPVLSDL